jgi:hypothetical protein
MLPYSLYGLWICCFLSFLCCCLLVVSTVHEKKDPFYENEIITYNPEANHYFNFSSDYRRKRDSQTYYAIFGKIIFC